MAFSFFKRANLDNATQYSVGLAVLALQFAEAAAFPLRHHHTSIDTNRTSADDRSDTIAGSALLAICAVSLICGFCCNRDRDRDRDAADPPLTMMRPR